MFTDIAQEGPDWINPVQVWDKWRVLIDEVMNFSEFYRVIKKSLCT
jgi:hypothetical protein